MTLPQERKAVKWRELEAMLMLYYENLCKSGTLFLHIGLSVLVRYTLHKWRCGGGEAAPAFLGFGRRGGAAPPKPHACNMCLTKTIFRTFPSRRSMQNIQ